MKVLILYRPNSEYGRVTEEFISEFESRSTEAKLDVLDVDSRDGSAIASLYDVMSYPAILVLADDGYLQKSWVGNNLPLIDEVIGYARA